MMLLKQYHLMSAELRTDSSVFGTALLEDKWASIRYLDVKIVLEFDLISRLFYPNPMFTQTDKTFLKYDPE